MKKQYIEPQMKVVELKPVSLICTSKLESVSVSYDSVMEENEVFE